VPASRSPLVGSLVVVSGAAMFATLGPLSRLAYEQGIEPVPLVAWRAGVGALVLGLAVAVVTGAQRRSDEAPAASRRTTAAPTADAGRRPLMALSAAIVAGLFLNLAIFAAYDLVTVALALLGFYTYPAMITAVDVISGRERLTHRRLAALGIATAGMALVVAGGFDGAEGIRANPLGILLALGAAACQTVFVTVSRGYRAVPAGQAMTAILAGSAIGALVLAAATGPLDDLTMPLREPRIVPILMLAGTLGAAIPSTLFLVGIRLVGGTRTGILMLFEPLVGVVLAALLLDEAIRPVQGLGGAGILAAAILLQLAPESDPGPPSGDGDRNGDAAVLAPAGAFPRGS
jgi:drug/metabolite transporter (DMT)-like permease